MKIFIVNQTTMELVFGMIVGAVITFIAIKTLEMGKDGKVDGTNVGGGTVGGGAGEVPKDFKK